MSEGNTHHRRTIGETPGVEYLSKAVMNEGAGSVSVKQRSPSSNAAAALLVGMSMMTQHRRNLAHENHQGNESTQEGFKPETSKTSDQTPPSATEGNVEEIWRNLRTEVTNQAEVCCSKDDRYGVQHSKLELPKGVTRRPSGAWQAQIYFAGKTRYIGVWDEPHQAAAAYNLAKQALQELKQKQPKKASRVKSKNKDLGKRQRQEPIIQTFESGMKLSQQNNGLPLNLTVSSLQPSSQPMITPKRDIKVLLPPSITWPSSASSCSTAGASSDHKLLDGSSPSYFTFDQQRPFKKRMIEGHLLNAATSLSQDRRSPSANDAILPQSNRDGQSSDRTISAFSQHPSATWTSTQSLQLHAPKASSTSCSNKTKINKSKLESFSHNPLHHQALQLLSLRPPSSTSTPNPSNANLQSHLAAPSFWSHPQSAQLPLAPSLHTGHFAPPSFSNSHLHHHNYYAGFPQKYSPPSDPSPSIAKSSKSGKRTKNSSRKNNHQSSSKAVLSEHQIAQNNKWKRIRTEVIQIFNVARERRKSFKLKDFEDPILQNKTFDKDVLRGITVRPSGKFQAQLYYGGRSRYIGVFDTKQEAASAYEMIRSKIKEEPIESSASKSSAEDSSSSKESSMKPQIVSAASSVTSIAGASEEENEVAKDLKEKNNSVPPTQSDPGATNMRSITPSPTPRNDGTGQTSKTLIVQ